LFVFKLLFGFWSNKQPTLSLSLTLKNSSMSFCRNRPRGCSCTHCAPDLSTAHFHRTNQMKGINLFLSQNRMLPIFNS
jgi:hypothetical protein